MYSLLSFVLFLRVFYIYIYTILKKHYKLCKPYTKIMKKKILLLLLFVVILLCGCSSKNNLHGLKFKELGFPTTVIGYKTTELKNNTHEIVVYREYDKRIVIKETYVFKGKFNGEYIYYKQESYEKGSN